MNNAVLSAIMDRTPAMRAHFQQMEHCIKINPLPLESEANDLGKGCPEGAGKGLLIIRNYRLAIFVASRYRGNGLDMEDLIGYAYIGLVLAADHYDPASGTDFAPYACRWIQGEVCKGLNDAGHPIRMPKRTRSIVTAIHEAQKHFFHLHGRDAMPEELADMLDLEPQTVTDLLAVTTRFDSLDTPLGDSDDTYTLSDTMPCSDTEEHDPYLDDAFDREQQVQQLLSHLQPRERQILEGLYFENKDFRQLGRELGLTTTRVRQIYNNLCRNHGSHTI